MAWMKFLCRVPPKCLSKMTLLRLYESTKTLFILA